MENEVLMSILTAITSALGIKEIWLVWKKRIEIREKKITKDANMKDKLMAEVILELKEKIDQLEEKIDELIEENTMLREKLARMEERLMASAANKAANKISKKEE